MTKEPNRKRLKRSSSMTMDYSTPQGIGRNGPSHFTPLTANSSSQASTSSSSTALVTQQISSISYQNNASIKMLPNLSSASSNAVPCGSSLLNTSSDGGLERRTASSASFSSSVDADNNEALASASSKALTSQGSSLPVDDSKEIDGRSVNLFHAHNHGESTEGKVGESLETLTSSSAGVSGKDKEDIPSGKKAINLSSKHFQDALEKIILNLGTQNGRNLPKLKLCMLQLCILMHSAHCKKPVTCEVQQCRIIKEVLGHMSICRDLKCKVTHCIPSKQLIRHWNACQIQTCEMCKTILDVVKDSFIEEGVSSEVSGKLPLPESRDREMANTSVNSHVTNLRGEVVMRTSPRPSDGRMVAPSDASYSVDVLSVSNHLPVAKSLTDNGDTDSLKSKASQPLIVWQPSEFVECLKPVLEKLWNLGVASVPFQRPVNPEVDLCPDYYNVIAHPMDLGTIRNKLNQGLYKSPWGFVDDVYLMLRNAWTYNHHTSKYYKYATKVAVAFEDQIDGIMQSLGYCCGRQYTYNPPVITCNTVNACAIKPYADYYRAPNGCIVCEECYYGSTGVVAIFDELTRKNLFIPKSTLTKLRNCKLPPEDVVSCTRCGRVFHNVCVLYMPDLWPYGYVCNVCVLFYGIKYIRNRFSAKAIPETALSQHLEQRMNKFFAKRSVLNPNVCIRVLASSLEEATVLPKFKSHYPESPGSFSYVSKAIYAFQERDGNDVCFFSMYVQEYGSDVPSPNTRCVYLAYLDSVNYFTPSSCRTGFYNDIIQGYMEYIKQRGFVKMFIWSCPPSPGDDYIFHCHPENQKTPKSRRLHEWYRNVLDKSVFEGTIESYKDMFIYALEQNFKSAKDLPYFYGDYWPTVLEELLGEIDKSANNGKATERSGVEKQTEKPQKKKGYKAKGAKTRRMKDVVLTGNEALMEKLFDSLKKNREMFFVVEFYSARAASGLPLITDTDKLSPNELTNNRTSFLIYARSNNLEFSSLRRAKYSTQAALVEYERCSNLGVVCDNCAVSVGNSNGLLACHTCRNYQLCLVCYEELGHEHRMHQTWNSKELRNRISDLQCLKDDLKHSASCTTDPCTERNCTQLKNALDHMKNCSLKKTCKKCRCIFVIVFIHARSCTDENCSLVLCNDVRRKQNDKRCAQQENEVRLMRRRMQVMTTEESGGDGVTTQMKQSEADAASCNSSRGKGSRLTS